jgi:hypothetical protein
MKRRRRADQLQDRILELENRLSVLSSFNTANDASLADEIAGIYELLPQYRDALRNEVAKRKKHRQQQAS